MVSSSNEAISCVLDTLEDRMGDRCVKAVRQPCIDRSDGRRGSLDNLIDQMLDLMALVRQDAMTCAQSRPVPAQDVAHLPVRVL